MSHKTILAKWYKSDVKKWHVAFGAHSQIPKCCVKAWIIDVRGGSLPASFNRIYSRYLRVSVCVGTMNDGDKFIKCPRKHGEVNLVRYCSDECAFLAVCRVDRKRYRCYGKPGCQNHAPKEGMCESCSRKKYSEWLHVEVGSVSNAQKRPFRVLCEE